MNHSIQKHLMSIMASTILMVVGGVVAISGVFLTTLYLVKYIDTETPEIVKVQCFLGADRPDCPSSQKELNTLKTKLNDLAEQTAKAETKLASLKAVEDTIDTLTLFTNHIDPISGYEISVGTIYKKLIEPEKAPDYYCYVVLGKGQANENRHFYIRDHIGDVHIGANTLNQLGISHQTLTFARSVCKPTLIGEKS